MQKIVEVTNKSISSNGEVVFTEETRVVAYHNVSEKDIKEVEKILIPQEFERGYSYSTGWMSEITNKEINLKICEGAFINANDNGDSKRCNRVSKILEDYFDK